MLRYLLPFFLLLAIPAVHAQQDAPEPVFSIEFRALSWDNTLRDLYYRKGNKEQALFVPNRGLSPTYEYTGTSPLRVYRREKGPDGTSVEKQVAKVPLRKGESSYLVLMFEPPNPDQGVLKALPIADSEFRAEEDQLVVFNFTRSKLAGDLGGARFTLPSLGFKAVGARKDEKGNLRAQLALQTNDGFKPVYSTTWTLRDGLQLFVFVTAPEGENGSVRVKKIAARPEEAVRFPEATEE